MFHRPLTKIESMLLPHISTWFFLLPLTLLNLTSIHTRVLLLDHDELHRLCTTQFYEVLSVDKGVASNPRIMLTWTCSPFVISFPFIASSATNMFACLSSHCLFTWFTVKHSAVKFCSSRTLANVIVWLCTIL